MAMVSRGFAPLWRCFVFVCCFLPALAVVAAEVVPDQYVVMLDRTTPDVDAAAKALAARYDGRLLVVWKHAVKGFGIRLSEANAMRLRNDRRVISIEQDSILRPSAAGVQQTGAGSGFPTQPFQVEKGARPVDPLWHLTYISHRQRPPIGNEFRYAYANDGSWGPGVDERVRVYVIDEGVWANHVEFQASGMLPAAHLTAGFNAAANPDYVRTSGQQIVADPIQSDPYSPLQPCGATTAPPSRRTHGTGVASMIVGRNVGVAKGAEIYSITAAVCGSAGVNDKVSTTAIFLSALDHVVEQQQQYLTTHEARRAAVLSMSMFYVTRWTSDVPLPRPRPNTMKRELDVLEEAFKSVVEAGVPVVVSANNQNGDACESVPARLGRRSGRGVGVITVGGIHALREERWVNDHGSNEADAGSNHGQCVDIFAPASHIPVAFKAGSEVYSPGHAGTSYSAPIVAGLIARILATDETLRNRNLTTDGRVADKVWEILAANASPFVSKTIIYQSMQGNDLDSTEGEPRVDAASPRLRVYLGGVTFRKALPRKVFVGASPESERTLPAEVIEGEVAYQWYRGQAGDPTSAKLSGATSASYIVSEPGDYWVRVRRTDICPPNEACSDQNPGYYADSTTVTAIAGVCTLAEVRKQPQSKVITGADGTEPMFSVELGPVSGPLQYQWFEVTEGIASSDQPTRNAVGQSGNLSTSTAAVTVPGLSPDGECDDHRCLDAAVRTYQLRVWQSESCETWSDTVQVRKCPVLTPGTITYDHNENTLLYPAPPDGVSMRWLYSQSSDGPFEPMRIDLKTADDIERNDGATWRTYRSTSVPAIRPGYYKVLIANDCDAKESKCFALPKEQILPYYELKGSVDDVAYYRADELVGRTFERPSGERWLLYLLAEGKKPITPDPDLTQFEWSGNNVIANSNSQPFETPSITHAQTIRGRAFDARSQTWSPWVPFNLRPKSAPPDPVACDRTIAASGAIGAGARCALSQGPPLPIRVAKYKIVELTAVLREILPDGQADIPITFDPNRPTNFFQDNFYYEWRVGGSTVVGPKQGYEYLRFFHEVVDATTVTLLVRTGPDCPPYSVTFDIGPTESEVMRCELQDRNGDGQINKSDREMCPEQVQCRRRAVTHNGLPTLVKRFTPGEVAVFSAPAETLPSTYEWYRRQGTSDTLIGTGETITVTLDVAAEYYVITTTAIETSVSHHLVALPLDASNPVVITPTERTVIAGQSTTFAAFVDGVDPNTLEYEWRAGSTYNIHAPIIGRWRIVTISGLPDNETFWCRVIQNRDQPNERIWNSEFVTVTVDCTNNVTGIVNARPKRLARGQAPMLVPTGTGKLLTYEWTRVHPDAVPVVISRYMNPKPIVTAPVTTFRAVATDVCGQSGDLGTVSVYLCVPTIHEQPDSIVLKPDDPTTLSLNATPAIDGQPLTIRWYRVGDTNMSSPMAEGPSFDPVVVPGTSETFFAAVSTACGDGANVLTSQTATVEVCSYPEVTVPSTTYQSYPGIPVTLIVTDTSQEYAYQWYRGVSGDTAWPLPGKTDENLFIAADETTQYWCRATSRGLCTTDSPTITLQICAPPAIDVQPQDATVFLEGTTTLSVSASTSTGVAPDYQWQHRTTSGEWTTIAGATASTLQTFPFNGVQYYRVRVTTGHCSTTSNEVTVTQCSYSQVVGGGERKIGIGESTALTLPPMSPVLTKTITWYRGDVGDRSHAVKSGEGTNLTYDTPPGETVMRQYWAEFTSGQCTSRTNVYTVYVCKPQITAQPGGSTIAPQSFATLAIAATDVSGQTYQWYAGTAGDTSNPVANATAAILIVSPATTTSYWCRVSTPCGLTADSSAATVTVCSPAAITGLTQSPVSIVPGASTHLSVAATGTDLTYQWYRGNSGDTSSPIGGGSDLVLTVTPSATTNYWCRVTSQALCSTDSGTVTVDVCALPAINGQPQSQSMFAGGTAILTVSATSDRPVTYQWYVGTSGTTSSPVSGATASSLSVSPAAATTYWVRVRTGVCVADSAAATVSICAYPELINAAAPTTNVYSGDQVTLALPSMSPPREKAIRWYAGPSGVRNTIVATGTGTNLSYQTPPMTTSGQYWAEFVHEGCTTRTETYTINVCKPTIAAHPQPSTILNGSQAVLSVSATGSPLTYQWYIGNSGDTSQPIAGATASAYTPSPSVTTTYWVRVTGCSTNANSGAATVTVCHPPVITNLAQSGGASGGSTAALSVTATGVNLAYQWYRGQSGDTSTPIQNATSSTYTFTAQTTAYYWVRVTSACNGTSADSTTLLYSVLPTIQSQPASLMIPRGTTTTLTVGASGAYLTYQWYKDASTPIAGATSASYATPALMGAAEYWVRVGSGVASVNSAHAQIAVCDGPTIIGPITSVSNGNNYSLTVNVHASQQSNVKYQWYRGVPGNPSQSTDVGLSGATKVLFNVTTPTTYWVRVWWLNDTCYADTPGKTIP
jgi:hypothetical protein